MRSHPRGVHGSDIFGMVRDAGVTPSRGSAPAPRCDLLQSLAAGADAVFNSDVGRRPMLHHQGNNRGAFGGHRNDRVLFHFNFSISRQVLGSASFPRSHHRFIRTTCCVRRLGVFHLIVVEFIGSIATISEGKNGT